MNRILTSLAHAHTELHPSPLSAGRRVCRIDHPEPVKDNTLYGEVPGEQAGGAGQHFFTGNNSVNGPSRGLLASTSPAIFLPVR